MFAKWKTKYSIILTLLFCRVADGSPADFFSNETYGKYERILRVDLAALTKIKFTGSSTLFETTFGSENGSVARYFYERIDRFTFRNGYDGKIAAFEEPSTLVVFAGYFAEDQTVRLSALVHEAAHRDSAHIKCPSPYFFRMTPGPDLKSDFVFEVPELSGNDCDKDLSRAYGVQYIFLSAVAYNCPNCTVAEKQNARIAMDDSLLRIVDPRSAHLLWKSNANTKNSHR